MASCLLSSLLITVAVARYSTFIFLPHFLKWAFLANLQLKDSQSA